MAGSAWLKKNPVNTPVTMVKSLLAGDSLKARVVRGGALMSMGSVAEHFLRFVRNMILTRLLVPESLGVMTIILAINAALEAFTEVGIREAVVQHKDAENRSFLYAAWWLACGRAIVLCTIGIALAPFLTSFYAIPHATNLLRISFLAILFNGTMSSYAFVAMKKMQYGKWVTISEGGSIGGILITLTLVAILRDIRALVFGYVAEAALRMILSFIICPFVPGLKFDKVQSSILLRFAQGMAGVPLLTFVFMQADIFLLGKMISKHDIGLYGMAATLAGIPAVAISVLINPVMMPVFSQMRDVRERLNETLIRLTRAMSVMGFPAAAFVMIFGDLIIGIIYGKAYSPAGMVLGLLFLSSLCRTLASPIPAIYLGLGKPAQNRTFTAIRTIILLAIIYPLIKLWGMNGAALAGLAAMSAGWIIQALRMRSLTSLDLARYFGAVLAGAAVAIVVLVLCITMHAIGNPLVALCAGTALSMIGAATGAIMAYRPEILKKVPGVCTIIDSKWLGGMLLRRKADV